MEKKLGKGNRRMRIGWMKANDSAGKHDRSAIMHGRRAMYEVHVGLFGQERRFGHWMFYDTMSVGGITEVWEVAYVLAL